MPSVRRKSKAEAQLANQLRQRDRLCEGWNALEDGWLLLGGIARQRNERDCQGQQLMRDLLRCRTAQIDGEHPSIAAGTFEQRECLCHG